MNKNYQKRKTLNNHYISKNHLIRGKVRY